MMWYLQKCASLLGLVCAAGTSVPVWRDGSVIKTICFSYRGVCFPALTLGGSQLSVSPVPRNPLPRLTSSSTWMPEVHMQMSKYTHVHININK